MDKIGIYIPTWEYNGMGDEVLEYMFQTIETQTFRDFSVIVSDHSQNDKIKLLCDKWRKKFFIAHHFNENGRGIVAANMNNLLRLRNTEWIKFMDQDDYFLDENALKILVDNMHEGIKFIATAYVHTRDREVFFNHHVPHLHPLLCITNTIGTLSCVAVKSDANIPFFDENLRYTHDTEWFDRFIAYYGTQSVRFVGKPTIVNFLHGNSVTSTMTQEKINEENQFILRKRRFIE